MTYSLHTIGLVLAMATPMRFDLRSEGDHHVISEGTAAGLFEPVPLSDYPACAVNVPGFGGKRQIGIRLTEKGLELARQIKLEVDHLLNPVDKVGEAA